ncbi:MAG: type II secretion system F family protein [Phycisphaerales bacterium]|nr:type II secretion system F family protein [Phycisphaerales bacterium]
MRVYRYRAIPMGGGRAGRVDGELAAESPAALRASLRRIGLQVIDARPARRIAFDRGGLGRWLAPLVASLRRHARMRRVGPKAELYDSLATMLEAGLPVVDAVTTLAGSGGGGGGRKGSALRTMLVEVREELRDGAALDEAMERHSWWFEPAEVAMARAARASGELPGVLRALAERHERSGALSAKIVGALTYPAVVCCVGVGVVVFLSIKTLPDLVGILRDAGIEPPRLTIAIIAVGRGIVRYGLVGVPLAGAAGAGAVAAGARLRRSGWRVPGLLRRLVPGFARRALLARAWTNLAELVRTGVPLVESLKITAPTVSGWLGGSLASGLERAAGELERGASFADSLADPAWFDDECRGLIAIGESAGELPEILGRLAARTHRSATRAIDRLASLLEPAVILTLATLIGFVVMGAVLPILRLQRIV